MKYERWLSNICEKTWYGSNRLHYPWIPLSLLYRTLVFIRRQWFLCCKKNRQLPVPVIVIGGISVGGTGKTPMVIALAKWLKIQGYNAGIISRGYRSKRQHRPHWVEYDDDAAVVGDEPLLIKHKTGQAVVVFRDRYAAAQQLLNQSHENIDIILSDDGLQHYALPRDIEIALVDGSRRFGNGWLLPAGPLREPKQRLLKTDFVVVKTPAYDTETEMKISPVALRRLSDDQSFPLNHFQQIEVHAVAGIAHPLDFFNTLEQLGMKPIRHAFPDHCRFKAVDFEFTRDYPIIITEKDAVKCTRLLDKKKKEHTWILEMEAILDTRFLQRLLQKVSSQLEAR